MINKKSKLKEIGIPAYFFICVSFIFVGYMFLKNNTSTNSDSVQMINSFGSSLLFAGVLGLILGAVVGLIFLIKYIKENN